MTTTHVFADEQDRRRHIDAWERPEHRWVDFDICEICGVIMPLPMAYEYAEELLKQAMHILEHAADGDPRTEHFAEMTNIAIGAALEQLQEDRP